MSQIDTRTTLDILLEDLGPKSLSGLEWLSQNGQYISGEALAVAIEANPGQPLPDGLRDYICRFLRGKVKKKRGRKEADKVIQFLTQFVVAPIYQKELRRIRALRKSRGREAIGKGEHAPHEEAAKIIKDRFSSLYGTVSPRRIANMLSSHKFG